VTGRREIHPVTPERWPDMVALFERRGPRGGHRNVPAYGCWCMREANKRTIVRRDC